MEPPYHTIYVIESDTGSGTIPFEADSDTAAIERGKELAREYMIEDYYIPNTVPEVGNSYCVEWVLWRKEVHSHHHDDYEVLGCEGTLNDGADRVDGFAFNIERIGSGDNADDFKITVEY